MIRNMLKTAKLCADTLTPPALETDSLTLQFTVLPWFEHDLLCPYSET